MLQSDSSIATGFLSRLLAVTVEISNHLDTTDEFGKDQIAQLDNLYKKRKDIMIELDAWLQSDQAKKFLDRNKDEWNKRISIIIQQDEKNIYNIKEVLKDKEKTLRSILKSKSLLIYSKEKGYGY